MWSSVDDPGSCYRHLVLIASHRVVIAKPRPQKRRSAAREEQRAEIQIPGWTDPRATFRALGARPDRGKALKASVVNGVEWVVSEVVWEVGCATFDRCKSEGGVSRSLPCPRIKSDAIFSVRDSGEGLGHSR